MRKLLSLAALLVAVAVGALWWATAPSRAPASALPPHAPDLKNGEVMFHAGGCASCHARPGEGDRATLGGGRALRSAFGVFYAPNISPHPTDGVGNWSEADFVVAMREGASPDGRHYYPAFPYTSYRRMKIEDVRDLFAYLRTLPPVAGRAPAHDAPFPFNVRRLLGGWKLLFMDGAEVRPDPAQSPQWSRGAYLVNGPGHCAECHSPRNALGAIDPARRFAGGPNPAGEGWVPNITQKSLSKWSEDDIARVLESGELPDGDTVGGDMREVVRNTSRLPAEDRAAVAVYVKSLPPVEGPPKPAR
jgi:mono/diheme cytochrome c family protein